jgi:hypothetical protein
MKKFSINYYLFSDIGQIIHNTLILLWVKICQTNSDSINSKGYIWVCPMSIFSELKSFHGEAFDWMKLSNDFFRNKKNDSNPQKYIK